MAIRKRIKAQNSEFDRGRAYVTAYPIDDTQTSGVEWTKLVTIKADGASAKFYDFTSGVGGTLVAASNADETTPAMGIIYDTSLKNVYGGLSLDDSLVYYPIGSDNNHENKPLSLVKEIMVEVYDSTDVDALVYNTVKTALAGTVVVDGKTVTGTSTAFNTALEAGDYIQVGTEIRQVAAVGSATSLTVGEEFTVASTGATAYIASDIDKPVYLGATGDFQKLKPATGRVQIVGYIRSGKHVEIKLEENANVANTPSAVEKIKVIDITTTPTGSEDSTGWSLPAKAIVKKVWVDVLTAEATGATKTLDIGTDGSGSNDPDGFINGVSVSTTGVKKGTLDDAGQTLGVLLYVDEDGAGAVVPEEDVTSGGETITYTAGSADWAEFTGKIYIQYVELA
jgi:hypothetical protein